MEINVPAKILRASVSTSTVKEVWPHDDSQGDTFWIGGSNPKPYRWQITMGITTQNHSSHLTREPNEFNGLDVKVGDWVAGASDGIALRIISVSSKTETSIICIVEDILRYNTFRSTTGNGIFSIPGNAIIFQVNEHGNPILDPIPFGFVSTDFSTNIESRFRAFTLQENFPLKKTNNGFLAGDSVSIDPSSKEFELTDTNSFDRVIGVVSAAGPGPNQFLLKPTNKIVENLEPALPGTAGDFIFADTASPGDFTTTDITGRPSFIQLSDSVPTILSSSVANGTTAISNQFSINGVTVTATTGTGTIDDIIVDINLLTGSHNVIASKIFTPTSATTNAPDLFYALVGNFTDSPGPASATINGTLVTFSTNDSGVATFATNVAIQGDMANDINDTNITDIVAMYDSTTLTIMNNAGGAITIVNSNSDTNGTPFAGPASGSGIPLSTVANTDELIRFTKLDGGEIIFQDITGSPVMDYGLISGQNGRLPLGLAIEQGIRKGDMFVVANISARNALTPLIGDQAFVLDKDDSEWGMFIYDGSNWVVTGTEESAEVDSASESTTVSHSTPTGTILIKEVNDGARVSWITVDVQQAFDGSPTISVGDSGNTSRLISDNEVDLSVADVYGVNPAFHYNFGTDVDVNVTWNSGSSTVGFAIVTITYS